MQALEAEKLLQNVEFPSDEEKLIRGFQFLTLKPIIFILNVGEDQLEAPPTKDVEDLINTYDFPFGKAALRLEAELSLMDDDERTEFMADYGIKKTLVKRYEAVCYKALNYISFLTYGPEECRAWNVKRGSTAWEAGGRIHSDIQRGFIAAETIAFETFKNEVGLDEQAAKKKGLVRMEGKDYPVKDGDIIFYKFNV
jgi:ribosome-binding ATPase YchF (GTP1/OBG family)